MNCWFICTVVATHEMIIDKKDLFELFLLGYNFHFETDEEIVIHGLGLGLLD